MTLPKFLRSFLFSSLQTALFLFLIASSKVTPLINDATIYQKKQISLEEFGLLYADVYLDVI